MSAVPWLQVQGLLNSVAQTWAKLIGMRFLLGIMPLAEAQPLVDELWVLVRSLISEGVEADREARAAAGWTDARPAAPPVDVSDASPRSIQQNVERGHRLLALHREAEQLGPQAGETDDLLARMAELEQEAALAGDGLTAGYAAIARADIYFGANRVRDAAAVLEVAHVRLGDGDGLDVARRRTLLVQLLRRLARAAVLQKQFVLVSQLCGAAISGFEQERDPAWRECLRARSRAVACQRRAREVRGDPSRHPRQ